MLCISLSHRFILGSSKSTIALLVVGCVVLISGAVNEAYTKRSPIIPPRLFRTRTTAIILITNFLHGVVFFTGAFYLPLYFQVLGASATLAGVEMLPYSLGAAVLSAASGMVVSRTGLYRPVMWFGYALFALGMGLMITLDANSSIAEKVLFPLVAAIGLGSLFQTPLIGLQAAMPLKDVATSTGTFGFLRTLGGTVGVSIGQAIYSSVLRKKIRLIPNSTFEMSPSTLLQSVGTLNSIPDPVLRVATIQAYAQSISMIWMVNTPIICACLIMVLFVRHYTLQRNVVRAGDMEKGTVEVLSEPEQGNAEGHPEEKASEESTNFNDADIKTEKVIISL
jgi:hypothetical protein